MANLNPNNTKLHISEIYLRLDLSFRDISHHYLVSLRNRQQEKYLIPVQKLVIIPKSKNGLNFHLLNEKKKEKNPTNKPIPPQTNKQKTYTKSPENLNSNKFRALFLKIEVAAALSFKSAIQLL